MRSEPLVSIASITSAVVALLALLVAFDIPVTEQQQTAILGMVGVIAPLIVAIAARPRVTPNASVVEYESGGDVYAGEGSELPTDSYVREAGSLEPRHGYEHEQGGIE